MFFLLVQGSDALMSASAKDCLEVVKALLAAGGSVTARNAHVTVLPNA